MSHIQLKKAPLIGTTCKGEKVMYSDTIYEITVNDSERAVIEDVLNILDNCPIDLGNCDYVDIFRSIANKSSNVDVDSIKIIYESGGSNV